MAYHVLVYCCLNGLRLFPQIFRPIQSKRVCKNDFSIDCPGNGFSTFRGELRLDENNFYAACFGMLDELLKPGGFWVFSLNFNGNLPQSVGIRKVSPGG